MIKKGTNYKIVNVISKTLKDPMGAHPATKRKIRELLSDNEIEFLAWVVAYALDKADDLEVKSLRPKQ